MSGFELFSALLLVVGVAFLLLGLGIYLGRMTAGHE